MNINVHFQTTIKNWWLQNLLINNNPITNRLLYLLANFCIYFSIWFQCTWCSSCFNLLVLRFSSSDSTDSILFFTYNMLVKRHSDFIVVGFLTGVGLMGDLEMFLLNPSAVETIASSRISLNCFWLSHLPACLYKFLMFWRHLCLYGSLLLKYWSIPMVFTGSLRHVDYNIPLSTTHFCSNLSVDRI